MSLLVLAALTTLVCAYGGGGYGGGGGGSGGYGGGGGYGSIPLAVRSYHNIRSYDVPSSGYSKPVYVDVNANAVPVYMNFRSKSSYLHVNQQHEGQKGSYQESYSQDEPHVLKHTVKKPVYQEVNEIITPRRRITQEIQPVQEEIETLVARKSYGGGHGGGYGGGMGGGYGGGMGGGYGGGGY
nr:H/ACA ribonucleoprotein complex subunit 1-like [Dermatophagoides farinae]